MDKIQGYTTSQTLQDQRGAFMISLSFSNTIVDALEQEVIQTHKLNNRRLYTLGSLIWIFFIKISMLKECDFENLGNSLQQFQ